MTEMVCHTSVLTMTDTMGETPLHALMGVGSCHIDLVRTFVKACSCRICSCHCNHCSPSDGSQHDNGLLLLWHRTIMDAHPCITSQGVKWVSSPPSQDKHKMKCQAFSLTMNSLQDKVLLEKDLSKIQALVSDLDKPFRKKGASTIRRKNPL